MNKIELLGRLTKDVDVRYTASTNAMVVTFSVAVNRRFAKQGEERQTDFFNIVAYGKTAEFISKYFSKGQGIAIVGRIQNNNYEKDGKKIYHDQIIAEEIYFAGGNKADKQEETQQEETQFEPVQADWITNDDLPF